MILLLICSIKINAWTQTITLSSAAFPAAASNINSGVVYNPLYSFKVVVSGTVTSATLTSVTITTAGSYTNSDIPANGFRLFYSTAASLSGAGVVYLGSGFAATGNSITFNSLTQSFTPGLTAYLIVTADINSSATATANHTVSINTPVAGNLTFSTAASIVNGAYTNGLTQTIAVAPSYTSGNLAVVTIGNGAALSSKGTPVAVTQFNTTAASQTGTVVTSLPTCAALASAAAAIPKALVQSGNAVASEGNISLSGNGKYLIIAGYNSYVGESNVTSSTSSTTDDGVIGKIDATGMANTITSFQRSNTFSGNNFRSACSFDGTGYWATGASATTSQEGVFYIADGTSKGTGTAIASGFSSRVTSLFNGQVYLESTTILSSFNTPLPYTSSAYSSVATAVDPEEYVLLAVNGSAVPNLLYLASNSNAELMKFSLVGGIWVSNGFYSIDCAGVTGNVNCNGNVTLYVTVGASGGARATSLVKLIDLAGQGSAAADNINIAASPITLATAAANYSFGGVAFTPYQDLIISTTGQTIAPGIYRNITVTNTGSATLTGNVNVLGNVSVAGVLDCAVYDILDNTDFSSSFTLQAGGTLKTADPNGLTAFAASGAIQTCVYNNVTTGYSSTRNYNTAANYVYESNGAQVTGNGLPATVNDLTLSNTSATTVTNSLAITTLLTLSTGTTLALNGNTITINGDLSSAGTGTFTGSSTSNMIISSSGNGSGNISGNLIFASAGNQLNNFTLNLTSGGTASLGSSLTIGDTATLTAGMLAMNGSTLTLNGILKGNGTLTGSASSSLYVGGSFNTSLGILNFTSGAQLLNNLTINRWNGAAISNAATLGTNLTTGNLILKYGVLSTGYNLFTVTNAGISAPNIPWAAFSTSFGNSYVATCDSNGVPISVANNTTPLTGAYGFQINNIGPLSGDVYFPVGASFLPDSAGSVSPTPNRMMLNMTSGVATNFNVVVNYGDINNTPDGRVNRIWYVNAADTAAADRTVNMKLFFVERSLSGWPVIENEVENAAAPFDYTNITLVERDYNVANPNFIAIASGSDITDYANGTYNNQEVFARYTVGVSTDAAGNKNGIYEFNRFTISSGGNIILPVKVINFKAYQQSIGVQTSWTSLDESNMNDYEIQRSTDAINFIDIGTVAALNNGQPSINYSFFDNHPSQGNNYYRIKIVSKAGTISYTNIQVVVIGGEASSINIYPNPVINHTFVLQINNIAADNYNLEIYNTAGQLILNRAIDHAGGSASQTIQLPEGIAQGEYYLKLFGSNTEFSKMIGIQ